PVAIVAVVVPEADLLAAIFGREQRCQDSLAGVRVDVVARGADGAEVTPMLTARAFGGHRAAGAHARAVDRSLTCVVGEGRNSQPHRQHAQYETPLNLPDIFHLVLPRYGRNAACG